MFRENLKQAERTIGTHVIKLRIRLVFGDGNLAKEVMPPSKQGHFLSHHGYTGLKDHEGLRGDLFHNKGLRESQST